MSESERKGPNILPGGSAPRRSMRMSRVAQEEREDDRGGSGSTSGPEKKDAVMRRTLLPTWRKKLNGAPDVDPATKENHISIFDQGGIDLPVDLSNRISKLWPIRKNEWELRKEGG